MENENSKEDERILKQYADDAIRCNISDFAKMVGVEPSKVRYYEKLGLPGLEREKNGYRVFTETSAFLMNMFRSIYARGFTIKESLKMTENYSTRSELIEQFKEKEQSFEKELAVLQAKAEWTKKTRKILEASQAGEPLVWQENVEDYYLLPASKEGDFSVAIKNGDIRMQWNDYFPVVRFVTSIDADKFSTGRPVAVESGQAIKVSDLKKYGLSKDESVEHLSMGSCICFFAREGGITLSLDDYPYVKQLLTEKNLKPDGKLLFFYLMLNILEDGNSCGIVIMPVRNSEKSGSEMN